VAVLDVGFVQCVVGISGVPQGGVKDFLFDLGVNSKRLARRLCDLLHTVVILVFLEFLELFEKLAHFCVVGFQDIQCGLRRRATRSR
jgi:hypothetical protein